MSTISDYEIMKTNGKLERYSIEPLSINTDHFDYGGIIYNDTLYFSSTRSTDRRKVIDLWSRHPFLDIYMSAYNLEENSYGEVKEIKGDVNTKYHESTPVFTKDGKTMYFTRTNYTPKSEKDKNMSELRIYQASKVGDKWVNVKDLSINGDGFSNTNPALSTDEKTLYFSSNMPSTIGLTDIFYCSIFNDGTLGKPVNMGPKINTQGRESFPFITEDNELYFSSDGHYGFGGYDVYYVDLNSSDFQLLNIGKPINEVSDDFAFSINNRSKKGFFSSNRSKGNTTSNIDNIYSVFESKPISDLMEKEIKGKVVDKNTGEPLSNVTVEIKNLEGKIISTTKTDIDGQYSAKINTFKEYTVAIYFNKYDSTDKYIAKGKNSKDVNFEMNKNKIEIKTSEENIEKATDLSKALEVKQVYFDYSKSIIRKEAEVQLEKIVATMKIFPKMRIEIESYTDSRSSVAYNKKLSDKRSQSILSYLIKRGISKKRLTAKGFGESKLVNKCSDGVECSEEEHKLNRRSEFIVSSLR